jgi:hypothetical protein
LPTGREAIRVVDYIGMAFRYGTMMRFVACEEIGKYRYEVDSNSEEAVQGLGQIHSPL